MTLPSLDLYGVNAAMITAAIQDSRRLDSIAESTKLLAAALRDSGGFVDLTAIYLGIIQEDLKQSGNVLDYSMISAVLTAGIRVGHAIAMRQLEAASGTG